MFLISPENKATTCVGIFWILVCNVNTYLSVPWCQFVSFPTYTVAVSNELTKSMYQEIAKNRDLEQVTENENKQDNE